MIVQPIRRTATIVIFILLFVGCSSDSIMFENWPYQATPPAQLTPVPDIYLARTTLKPSLIADIGVPIQLEVRNDCVYSINEYDRVSLVVVPPDVFLHKENNKLALMHEDGTILYRFGESYIGGTEGISDHLESPIPERCEFEHLLPIY